jgi:hypothetical protein
VRGPNITGAVGSRGAASPVIHRLSTWMLLIIAPKAVEDRFLESVSPGMMGRASGPLGATDPTPCCVMNHFRSGMPRIALE